METPRHEPGCFRLTRPHAQPWQSTNRTILRREVPLRDVLTRWFLRSWPAGTIGGLLSTPLLRECLGSFTLHYWSSCASSHATPGACRSTSASLPIGEFAGAHMSHEGAILVPFWHSSPCEYIHTWACAWVHALGLSCDIRVNCSGTYTPFPCFQSWEHSQSGLRLKLPSLRPHTARFLRRQVSRSGPTLEGGKRVEARSGPRLLAYTAEEGIQTWPVSSQDEAGQAASPYRKLLKIINEPPAISGSFPRIQPPRQRFSQGLQVGRSSAHLRAGVSSAKGCEEGSSSQQTGQQQKGLSGTVWSVMVRT